MSKIDFDESCLGIVNIVTSNDLLLTGTLVGKCNDRNTHDHCCPKEIQIETEVEIEEEEFITIRLTQDLLAIPGSAGSPVSNPYYMTGDTVRINVDFISTISPSHF